MTYRTAIIKAALEKEVLMEQVKKEVANYIADLLKKKNKNTSEGISTGSKK